MQTTGAQASPNALPFLNLSREASASLLFLCQLEVTPANNGQLREELWTQTPPLSAAPHGTLRHPLAYQSGKLRVP